MSGITSYRKPMWDISVKEMFAMFRLMDSGKPFVHWEDVSSSLCRNEVAMFLLHNQVIVGFATFHLTHTQTSEGPSIQITCNNIFMKSAWYESIGFDAQIAQYLAEVQNLHPHMLVHFRSIERAHVLNSHHDHHLANHDMFIPYAIVPLLHSASVVLSTG